MGKHYRRRERRPRNRHNMRGFYERKRQGWGMGLYRNRRDGRICGVAAGLADYWDVADWVVPPDVHRRLSVHGYAGDLGLRCRCAAAEPQTRGRSRRSRKRRAEEADYAASSASANEEAFGPEMEYDERYHDYRPRRMFRYSDSAGIRLARARERLDSAVRRVEAMEGYVTSRRFKLNSEFRASDRLAVAARSYRYVHQNPGSFATRGFA